MPETLHDILARYFSGEASPEDEQVIEGWLAEDEQNRRDFALLKEMWTLSGETEPQTFDTNAAWKNVEQKISGKRSGKLIAFPLKKFAVAASILVIVGMIWVYNEYYSGRTIYASADARRVDLKDGSTVYLRKGSTLAYSKDYNRNTRSVTLTGEAFFDVEPDASRPFIITASNSRVQVLGTSFNVDASRSDIELVVKTGRVSFGPAADTTNRMIVVANEKAVLSGSKITKEQNTDPNFNAWQTRTLVFNNTTLPEVTALLRDYYGRNVYINPADSLKIAATQVTTRFSNQDLADVLKEISLITSFNIVATNDSNYQISLK